MAPQARAGTPWLAVTHQKSKLPPPLPEPGPAATGLQTTLLGRTAGLMAGCNP